ncbi:hypothetical protein BH20GEM2_BH20GEM2_11480 [soil metagenome]
MEAEQHPLDRKNPKWGASRYFTVTLRGTHRLADALSHLYVLVPVLDDEKHYWVGDDEVAKLLRHGRDWLASHPAREAITTRERAGRSAAMNEKGRAAALSLSAETRTSLRVRGL